MQCICDLCGSDLELVAKYGDGYIEPREEVYVCPNCSCQHIWREDTGWEYDDSDVDWSRVP